MSVTSQLKKKEVSVCTNLSMNVCPWDQLYLALLTNFSLWIQDHSPFLFFINFYWSIVDL